MSAEPKDQDNLSIQIEEIRDLLRSREWQHWLKFLRNRKSFLQHKVNTLLVSDQDLKAKIALALMNDVDKQIELFQGVLKDLESKKQGALNV